MKTAVETILVGKERVYNRRFLQMCGHYLVDPVACTPASGWEKGQVENQVGLVRERFFTPRLRVKSYDESRLICGFHYPTDLVAGDRVGRAVAKALLADRACKARFDETMPEIKVAFGVK